MATLSLNVTGTEDLYFPGIRAFDPASIDGQADQTTLPIRFAFIPTDRPAPVQPLDADWHVGAWTDDGRGWIKVGPSLGGVALAVGKYAVWMNVQGTQEDPRRQVGTLKIVGP